MRLLARGVVHPDVAAIQPGEHGEMHAAGTPRLQTDNDRAAFADMCLGVAPLASQRKGAESRVFEIPTHVGQRDALPLRDV